MIDALKHGPSLEVPPAITLVGIVELPRLQQRRVRRRKSSVLFRLSRGSRTALSVYLAFMDHVPTIGRVCPRLRFPARDYTARAELTTLPH